MKEEMPVGEEYYVLNLLPSPLNNEALARFCNESQPFVFDFLSKFCLLRLLIDLVSQPKGKVLVANYLAAHSDKLDRYDCSNLEDYVEYNFAGLVKLYGMVISLKNTCSSLLTNNQAEQQLEKIVANYRYINQKYFDDYAHDRDFYLYFQKEALPTNQKLSFHARYAWVIRDFTRRKDVDICITSWSSFLQEAIYHYDIIKNRLDNTDRLASSLYANARKKGVYIHLDALYRDNKISDSFKKDLMPSLLYNLLMRCQIKKLDYDYQVIRMGMTEPDILVPRRIYLYPRVKLYRFIDLDGNKTWGDLLKIEGFDGSLTRISFEIKLLQEEYTNNLVQNILNYIAKTGDAYGAYNDADLAKDLHEIIEPMPALLSQEEMAKASARFREAKEQHYASQIADAIDKLSIDNSPPVPTLL